MAGREREETVFQRLLVRVYKALPRTISSAVVRMIKPTFVIGVVAVIFDDDKRVLLLKHTYHTPSWRLPGGIMERRESPTQTAVREAKEEANCVIRPLGVVHAAEMKYSFDVAVAARLVASNPFVANAEVSDFVWSAVDQLPAIPPYQREFIQRAYEIVCLTAQQG